MSYRAFLTVLLFSFLSVAYAEPKAYDIVKYQGKGAGATIVFDLAYGYSEASELKTIDLASGKTTKFTMDTWDETRFVFVPEKAGGKIKSVTVTVDGDASPAPRTAAGTCVVGDKSVSFTLTKRK